MKCIEYIYNELEAKELADELIEKGFKDVELEETIDEDADEPCKVWIVSWMPKPLVK